jgi:hypothetical protein
VPAPQGFANPASTQAIFLSFEHFAQQPCGPLFQRRLGHFHRRSSLQRPSVRASESHFAATSKTSLFPMLGIPLCLALICLALTETRKAGAKQLIGRKKNICWNPALPLPPTTSCRSVRKSPSAVTQTDDRCPVRAFQAVPPFSLETIAESGLRHAGQSLSLDQIHHVHVAPTLGAPTARATNPPDDLRAVRSGW